MEPVSNEGNSAGIAGLQDEISRIKVDGLDPALTAQFTELFHQLLRREKINLDKRLQGMFENFNQILDKQHEDNEKLKATVKQLRHKTKRLKRQVKALEEVKSKCESEIKKDAESKTDLINELPVVFPTLVKVADRKYHKSVYPNSFIGSEAVDVIMNYLKLDSRHEAVSIARLLMEKRVFRPAAIGRNKFVDKHVFYTFDPSPFSTSNPNLLSISNTSQSSDDIRRSSNAKPSPFNGELHITLLTGKQMFPKKKFGTVKLYCKLQLDGHEFKTKSVPWHSNDKGAANFNQDVFLYTFHSNSVLVVQLYKKHSRKGSTKKGEFSIPLTDIPLNETVENWYTLLDSEVVKGHLHVKLHYSFIRGQDDGSYATPDLWPLSWSSRDPASLRRSDISQYHRCGIADIFPYVEQDIQPEQEVIALTSSAVKNIDSPSLSTKQMPILRRIEGIFEHGIVSPISNDSLIDFYLQRDSPHGEWTLVDSSRTLRGKVSFEVPRDIFHRAGRYLIRMVAKNNPHEVASGSIYVIEKGTRCVCFDIDGTLTPGDQEIIKQLALDTVSVNYNPNLRRGAVAVVRWWFARGYIPVYLSGRQGSAYNLTRDWLVSHGFPPGIIGHTNTHMPTMPIYSLGSDNSIGVGVFKRQFMQALIAAGAQFEAVYGNTMTDIHAYEKIGIPKDRTFILGPLGGREKTVALGQDFTTHFETFEVPRSPVPFYTTPEW